MPTSQSSTSIQDSQALMADHGPQIHRFKAQPDEDRTIKKRNRIPVSCIPCQGRRSKCNRERPCSTCTKRGERVKCVYSNTSRITSSINTSRNLHDGPQAQDRLKHLENLVLNIIQKPTLSTTASSNNLIRNLQNGSDVVTDRNGEDHSPDTGLPHWSAILDGIQELRSIMTDQNENSNSDIPHDTLETPVLLGGGAPLNLSQILLQYLPPKVQLERRLSFYFSSTFLVLPIVHPGQFQKQYLTFSNCPLQTDPLWVALLFSVLSLSAYINLSRGNEPDGSALERFMAGAAHCLNLGGYIHPKRFLLEALLLLAQCKYLSYLDPSQETALIVPVIIRLAYQSGLHREPPPSISPFEGEMRRRLWTVCKHFDIQLSCQFGVPITAPPGCDDTQSPRNLQDADLVENMKDLPVARPDNEVTPVLTFVIKGRIMDVLSKIYQLAIALEPIPEQTFLSLDREIRAEHERIPPILKIRPIREAFAESNNIIMARMTCEFLVQKSVCILHRKRMTAGNIESRDICTKAAMIMVREMAELNQEFQPTGRLHESHWLLTPTLLNDFLLGTMILCLALSTSSRAAEQSGSINDWSASPEFSSQLDILQQAHDICLDLSARSRGARRVADATAILLSRLGRPVSTNYPNNALSVYPSPASQNVNNINSNSIVHSIISPPATSSSSTSADQTWAFQSRQPQDLTPISSNPNVFTPSSSKAQVPDTSLGNIFNDSSLDVDWTAFDQYINSSAWEPTWSQF